MDARKDLSDAEVFRRSRTDGEMFALLVSRFERRIQRYVFGFVKDVEEAREVTQEVFLNISRGKYEEKEGVHFSTWLYRVARNLSLNRLRGKKNYPFVSLSEEEMEHLSQIVPGKVMPTWSPEKLIEEITRRAVRAGLSVSYYEILEHMLNERSYQDIAEELGITESAVKSLLFRARIQLREILKRET